MRRARTFLLLVATICMLGCDKGSVTVSCKHLEKYQSTFGILNAPQFALGDLVVLNTNTKNGYMRLGTGPGKGDTSTTTSIDETSIVSNADFDVSADVSLPAGINANVKTDVQNNTLFDLKNYSKTYITDPIAFANTKANAVQAVKDAKPDEVYFLVASTIAASDLSFKLKDATNVSAGVQLKQYGKYSVTVTYGCEGTLETIAKNGAPVMFKGIFLKYDAAGKQVQEDSSETAKLSDYNLMYAIQ
jgi:hypothetical protein